MKKSLQTDGLADGKLKIIASRLRGRMNERGLTVTELARKCDVLAHEVFDDAERPNLSRDRVSKILMNDQSRIGKGAARVISRAEIVVLAQVLDVAPEWLSNETSSNLPTYWDISDDPKYGRQFTHLLDFYACETGEMFLWGDSLLCSLTPPEFSCKFHLNLFSEFGSIGLIKEQKVLVQTSDHIVNVRRQKTFGNLTERKYTITQIVFLSELVKIAEARENYQGIEKRVRRKCFEDLRGFIMDEKYKINLIVARDEDAEHSKQFLRDFDRFGVSGDSFSMWGHHSGKVAWSEDAAVVGKHRKVLDELAERAAFRQPRQVADLLLQLSESMNEDVYANIARGRI